MLLSNQKYVDPKIASKLHTLQAEYQKFLIEKYQIESNQKLQPSTKNNLLKYNQTNLFQTKKMIQKYKLSLVDYFDQQINQITKNCIQNGNNRIVSGIQKYKQTKKNVRDKDLQIQHHEYDSQDYIQRTGLSQLCENELNSTKNKIQDSGNRKDFIQNHSREILTKSNVDSKSDNRSTNNKSSFYTLADKSKIIDRSMEIGQFNITSKFQRLSSSRPHGSGNEQQVNHKEKISSILQNYNKVSSIYYKNQIKKEKKVNHFQRRFNKTLLKRISKRDRIIQSLLIYINSLHQKQMLRQRYGQKSQQNQSCQASQMNLLSRISIQNGDSILRHSNISNVSQKRKNQKYEKNQQRIALDKHSNIRQKQKQFKSNKNESDTQELLLLHRQKNKLLQQKVKKLQEQLSNNIKTQKQTNYSYVIQLNSIMNKNKQLQKIQLQNQELKMQRMDLIRRLKDFNNFKIK